MKLRREAYAPLATAENAPGTCSECRRRGGNVRRAVRAPSAGEGGLRRRGVIGPAGGCRRQERHDPVEEIGVFHSVMLRRLREFLALTRFRGWGWPR